MKKLSFLFLLFSAFITLVNAQSLSSWQVNPGEGVVNLPTGVKSRNGDERLAIVYDYAKVPDKNSTEWKPVPLTNGVVNYGNSSSSILDKAKYGQFTQVDFTYFRAFLDLRSVPKDFKVQQVTVTVGNVDDQARKLLYNSNNFDGTPLKGLDGKRGGKDFTTDFTSAIIPGEINTFIIVQVDDNCCGNILNGGITVRLNGNELKPDVNWLTNNQTFFKNSPDYAPEKKVALIADKFKVNAFSVNEGQGKGVYFFGYENADKTTGKIVSSANPDATILQIKKVDLGSNTYAFKVENYPGNGVGKNAYLVAKDDYSVKIEMVEDRAGVTSLGAQFISIPAFTKAAGSEQFLSFESKLKSGHFLRHTGYVLKIDPKHPSELYKQDASWKIEKM